MGNTVQWNEKYFGTILLPLPSWPILGLAVQNCDFGLANLALRFPWFQRNSVDFVILQNPGAPPKNTKMRMGAAQEIKFGLFLKTLIRASCGHENIGNMKTPFSPQFWAFLRSAKTCQLQTQSNPEGDAKDEL